MEKMAYGAEAWVPPLLLISRAYGAVGLGATPFRRYNGMYGTVGIKNIMVNIFCGAVAIDAVVRVTVAAKECTSTASNPVPTEPGVVAKVEFAGGSPDRMHRGGGGARIAVSSAVSVVVAGVACVRGLASVWLHLLLRIWRLPAVHV